MKTAKEVLREVLARDNFDLSYLKDVKDYDLLIALIYVAMYEYAEQFREERPDNLR